MSLRNSGLSHKHYEELDLVTLCFFCVLLFSAVKRLLGVVEISYTETGFLCFFPGSRLCIETEGEVIFTDKRTHLIKKIFEAVWINDQ